MKALLGKLLSGAALIMLALTLLSAPTAIQDQKKEDKKEEKEEKPKEDKSKEEKKEEKNRSDALKRTDKLTAEQLAEVVILAYGGRTELQQIRTNGVEEGFIKLSADEKDIE